MDRFEAMGILVAAVERGQLLGGEPRAADPAGQGQSQGFGARRTPWRSPSRPRHAQARTDRCRTRLRRGMSPIAGRHPRSGTRGVRRIRRAAGGVGHQCARDLGRLHLARSSRNSSKVYADIRARLQFTNRNVSLLEEHIDLALRVGQLPDSNMVATCASDCFARCCVRAPRISRRTARQGSWRGPWQPPARGL